MWKERITVCILALKNTPKLQLSLAWPQKSKEVCEVFCGECYTHYTVCLSPLRTTVCGNLENVAAGTGREKSLQKESLIASRFSKGPSNRLGQKRDVDSTYQMNESRKTHNNGRGKKEMNNQDVFVFERKCRHTISRLFSPISRTLWTFFLSLCRNPLGKGSRKKKKRRAKRITSPQDQVLPHFFSKLPSCPFDQRRTERKKGNFQILMWAITGGGRFKKERGLNFRGNFFYFFLGWGYKE